MVLAYEYLFEIIKIGQMHPRVRHTKYKDAMFRKVTQIVNEVNRYSEKYRRESRTVNKPYLILPSTKRSRDSDDETDFRTGMTRVS